MKKLLTLTLFIIMTSTVSAGSFAMLTSVRDTNCEAIPDSNTSAKCSCILTNAVSDCQKTASPNVCNAKTLDAVFRQLPGQAVHQCVLAGQTQQICQDMISFYDSNCPVVSN